jgi:hypothetical protein
VAQKNAVSACRGCRVCRIELARKKLCVSEQVMAAFFIFLLFLLRERFCHSLGFTLHVPQDGDNSHAFDYLYEFPSSTDSNVVSFDFGDIYRKIDHYCQTTFGLPSNCKILLLRQLLKKLSSDMNYPSPWLIPAVARLSYTSDLIQAICQSSEYLTRFENEIQCQEQVENDVRAKKAWLSLYEVLPLRDSIVENDLIVMKDWEGVIEGNSFGYYEKIKALSKIADDPRVTTICEIGFNCGHSVSVPLLITFPHRSCLIILPILRRCCDLIDFELVDLESESKSCCL